MTPEERKIQKIKTQIIKLGPMLPGSMKQQFNVCGKTGCKCKDPENPIKHGPYYQLSFTVGGRSSTLFVKNEDVPEVRKRIRRYKRFRQLTTALTKAYVDFTRKSGLRRS